MSEVPVPEKTHGRELSLAGADPAREAVSHAVLQSGYPKQAYQAAWLRDRQHQAAQQEPAGSSPCLCHLPGLALIEQGSQAFS